MVKSVWVWVGVAALGAAIGAGLLVNIFERKQEAKNPFFRVAELTEDTDDPEVWGVIFRSTMRTIS